MNAINDAKNFQLSSVFNNGVLSNKKTKEKTIGKKERRNRKMNNCFLFFILIYLE